MAHDPALTIPALAQVDSGILHFFGTRHGPPASVRDGVMVSVRQVHGTDVLIIDQPMQAQGSYPGGWDAIVTNQPGVWLTIRTADCVPVLMYDPHRKVVAAIHAGWRGAVGRIVSVTVNALRHRFGSQASMLHVGIGPSAGPCCYEIDEPVLSPLRRDHPQWRQVTRERGEHKAMLDLQGLVRMQVEAGGVPASQVHSLGLCTICRPDLFYSYRREGRVTATMVSGIMLAG
jgi:YfiH family protein